MRTDELAPTLNIIADVLIPGTEELPTPSEMRLAADLLSRLRDSEIAALREAITRLDDDDALASLVPSARVDRMTSFAAQEPALFDVLRRSVYYAYYAQPTVIRLLRARGYDINESPQPQGYRMDPLTARDVAGVDRKRLVWIPADQVGRSLRKAS